MGGPRVFGPLLSNLVRLKRSCVVYEERHITTWKCGQTKGESPLASPITQEPCSIVSRTAEEEVRLAVDIEILRIERTCSEAIGSIDTSIVLEAAHNERELMVRGAAPHCITSVEGERRKAMIRLYAV